jgi:MoxR-like ATPase
VFTNLLLGDEINRASPKTQSALLECMEERQVTVDGTTYQLEQPFMVVATQNPVEHEGTYPLPESQLDRFLMRVSVGYPSHDAEVGILDSHGRSDPSTPSAPWPR